MQSASRQLSRCWALCAPELMRGWRFMSQEAYLRCIFSKMSSSLHAMDLCIQVWWSLFQGTTSCTLEHEHSSLTHSEGQWKTCKSWSHGQAERKPDCSYPEACRIGKPRKAPVQRHVMQNQGRIDNPAPVLNALVSGPVILQTVLRLTGTLCHEQSHNGTCLSDAESQSHLSAGTFSGGSEDSFSQLLTLQADARLAIPSNLIGILITEALFTVRTPMIAWRSPLHLASSALSSLQKVAAHFALANMVWLDACAG